MGVAMLNEPAAGEAAKADRIFAVAPEEELLYSLSPDGKRKFIHPAVRKGRLWHVRRRIAYGLYALFFALPLVPVNGHPALLFNLESRQSYVFGATFHPGDNLILFSFGLGVVVTVFFVASTFGRLWCGFACPQTVYLEFLFRPIEAWLEGSPANQKRLNLAPWDAGKLAIKAAKWAIWTVLALLMSATFVAYFTGWASLAPGLVSAPLAWKGALFTMALVSAAILFDFGWFRDQMCTIACPYGRLQSVISDRDTILVAYDEGRGEPRARMRDRVAGLPSGDCVNCGACLSVCPTGMDIRRGLQPECIGTGQCIDACDEVMRKLGKPTGLIRFTSEREQRGGLRHLWRLRTFAYLALMAVAWSAFVAFIATRDAADVEVLRGGREPYRLLTTGEVANQQRIRITNQLGEPQRFTVELLSPAGASLVLSQPAVTLAPGQVMTLNAVTTLPHDAFVDGQVTGRYVVRSDKGYRHEVEFLLLGPFGQAGGRR